MEDSKKWAPLVVVVALVAGAVYMKQSHGPGEPIRPNPSQLSEVSTATTPGDAIPVASATAPSPRLKLPTLIDLGSLTCVPCKRMTPILEELRVELRGKVEVVFINVREDSMSAELYGVRLIPTQVFLDGAGNEVARHEGFMSKEEILEQLAATGVPLGDKIKVKNP